MKKALVAALVVALGLGLLVGLGTTSCTLGDNAADAGPEAGNCGPSNCTAAQVCLYRECNASERCIVSRQCPAGTTPADCNGLPGCLKPTCPPVLQGCRDIPQACGGDVTCACGSICGGAASCVSVDGINALCAATN